MGHMKNFLFLLSFLSFCLSAAPTPALLFKINGSVVKVHVANKDGHHGVGSGVVVAKDHVVTNCHVIANAKGVHVTKFGKSHAPHSLLADWKNDLCILKFKYLELDPVRLVKNNTVDYETKVFSKNYGGNTVKPHTTFGRIKGIYNLDNYKIIQSSAWFAIGASGGGIFNYDGELIGITTFKTPGNTAFYYSMPVKIIKKLLDQGKEISVTTQSELPFWDAPPKEQPYFMQVVGATKQQSWNELKKITAKWIKEEPQEIEALYHHGYSFYELKDFTSAKTLLQKVIKQNNKHALAYLHLYKIAIIEKQEDDIGYYKSRIIKLDDSLIKQE